MRIVGLVVVSAICFVGCKSKSEEKVEKLKGDLAPLVEKYGDKTKATLAAIPEIGRLAVAAPKVTARETVGRKFEFDANRPLQSGTLVETAQLLVDNTSRPATIHIQEDLYKKRLNQVMDGTYKNSGESAKNLEADFKRVTNIGQIAAVRFHDVVKPQYARGDVLLYDVETKKQIGAFPFDAGLDKVDDTKVDDTKVDDKKGKKGKKGAPQGGGIDHKFHAAVKQAIYEELAAYLAGKPGPASPGREPPPAEKPADGSGSGSGDKGSGDKGSGDKAAKPATEKPTDKKPTDKKPAEKPPTDKGSGGW